MELEDLAKRIRDAFGTAQVSIIACERRLCEIAYHLMKERRCYE
jgi:hypothetical protein